MCIRDSSVGDAKELAVVGTGQGASEPGLAPPPPPLHDTALLLLAPEEEKDSEGCNLLQTVGPVPAMVPEYCFLVLGGFLAEEAEDKR
eukprot:6528147-Alexandrium_andersonii.AAC.1